MVIVRVLCVNSACIVRSLQGFALQKLNKINKNLYY